MSATLLSIQVGQPRQMGTPGATEPMQRPWVSAIFKAPLSGPVWLGRTQLEGDAQAEPDIHGGGDKAALVYASEHYPLWEQELDLPGFAFGAFGENFTTTGLTEGSVCIGDVYQVGEAFVQVTQPRQPCWKVSRRWGVKDLSARMERTSRTGWYLRVLQEGRVSPGDAIRLVERPEPEWTVTRATLVMGSVQSDLPAAERLAACPSLSASWQASLQKRIARGYSGSAARRLVGPNASQE
jgi:MOSC domain-containing protein YiiM